MTRNSGTSPSRGSRMMLYAGRDSAGEASSAVSLGLADPLVFFVPLSVASLCGDSQWLLHSRLSTHIQYSWSFG